MSGGRTRLLELIKAGKFALVGVANTLLDMGVFWLLTVPLLWNPYYAQLCSYSVGMINSYILNRSWTFSSRQRFFSPALLRFLVVNAAMLALSTALLWLLRDWAGLPTMLAKCGSVAVTLVANFVISRFWVFSS